jgi:hypothetical protein
MYTKHMGHVHGSCTSVSVPFLSKSEIKDLRKERKKETAYIPFTTTQRETPFEGVQIIE